jgi:hypothetical protein
VAGNLSLRRPNALTTPVGDTAPISATPGGYITPAHALRSTEIAGGILSLGMRQFVTILWDTLSLPSDKLGARQTVFLYRYP